MRRRHLVAGRHGDPLRRHSARPGLHLDDDQRPRRDPLLLLRGRRREAGRADRAAAGHHPERHPQGVHGAARLDLSGGAGAQGDRRHVRVGRRSTRPSGTPSRFPATTSARPAPTAAQELAFTLANGFCYVEHGVARGLDVDRFAPRLSFFWDVHNDFFEEIAKMRAARRIWARHLRERYGARDDRAAGACASTARRPASRSPRSSRSITSSGWPTRRWRPCLAAPSRCTPTPSTRRWRCPPRTSVRIALRTQQILAYETGVPNVADPLGGCYYVEALTDQLEREAEAIFAEIEAQGGVVAGHRGGLVPAADRTRRRRASSTRWKQRARTDRRAERVRGGRRDAGRHPEDRRRGRSIATAPAAGPPARDARPGRWWSSAWRRSAWRPPKTAT